MRHNLNELPVLLALLELKNLTRAAERLHMTQSAVSKTLAQLRQSFNDPLLVRQGQRYLLTPKAEQLQLQLTPLMSGLDGLYHQGEFEPARCQRSFVLASSDYVAQYIFPDIAAEFASQAPLAQIEFQLWQPKRLSGLADDNLDLVSTIIEPIPETCVGISQGQDCLVMLMRQGHPLAGVLSPSLEDYLSLAHLSVTGGGDKDSLIDRHLAEVGLERNLAAKVPFFHGAVALLARSDLVLTTPLHIAAQLAESHGLCIKTLPVALPEHEYYLFWHQRWHHDPAHTWFRELALPYLQGHLQHYLTLGQQRWLPTTG